MNTWIKGTRVRHNTKPEWGVGQLLEDANSETISIFFEDAGKKLYPSSAISNLTLVTGPDAHSVHLDNLYLPGPDEKSHIEAMEDAKLHLEKNFPTGLHGEEMKDHERGYKDALCALAADWYDTETLKELMHAGQYAEVVERAHRLVKHSTNNFPSQFEKMAFGNGIKAHTRQREFAEAFCAWVLPKEATQAAFEAFANELDHLGCAKWPILTAYRFLLHPHTDVLIKPENLQKAAKQAWFEINYRSELKWLTYSKVMEFYNEHMRKEIADLDPKDNIDVQNFIWCTDPAQYP